MNRFISLKLDILKFNTFYLYRCLPSELYISYRMFVLLQLPLLLSWLTSHSVRVHILVLDPHWSIGKHLMPLYWNQSLHLTWHSRSNRKDLKIVWRLFLISNNHNFPGNYICHNMNEKITLCLPLLRIGFSNWRFLRRFLRPKFVFMLIELDG